MESDKKMKFSRAGILILLVSAVLLFANCSVLNRIKGQQDLVDGAKAYKDRKFDDAERLFQDAVKLQPDNHMGQLFYARTLHSQYAANRTLTDKANQALVEYRKVIADYKKEVADKKKALDAKPGDEKAQKDYADAAGILGSSVGAISSLLDSLSKPDEWRDWQVQVANDAELPGDVRANALTSLASKQNTCANDISEAPEVKKTVTKEGKSVFTFSKPAKSEDFEQFKQCVSEGTKYIDQALTLNKESDSIWSYKTSLLVQQMRLAEMENRTADKDSLKAEADKAKSEFTRLAKIKKDKEDAALAAQKKKEEEESGGR
jgi:hypothetical protein